MKEDRPRRTGERLGRSSSVSARTDYPPHLGPDSVPVLDVGVNGAARPGDDLTVTVDSGDEHQDEGSGRGG
jgi:hypothetical protein